MPTNAVMVNSSPLILFNRQEDRWLVLYSLIFKKMAQNILNYWLPEIGSFPRRYPKFLACQQQLQYQVDACGEES